jgi:pimeloyl-ACP methyl ester carboxylesterase
MRRDTWDSRVKAESQISRNPFFRSMDPRVLKAYLAHALLELPEKGGGGVTLATPKAQESWSYVRSNFHPLPNNDSERDTPEARARERMLQPDVIPFSVTSTVAFTKPECAVAMHALPRLRPRTLYIYGEHSPINLDDVRATHLATTGTEAGGSGGAVDRCVQQKVLEGGGHLICFDKPAEVAADAAEWMGVEMARWRREKEFWDTADTRKSDGSGERKKLSGYWLENVKGDAALQRPRAKNMVKL